LNKQLSYLSAKSKSFLITLSFIIIKKSSDSRRNITSISSAFPFIYTQSFPINITAVKKTTVKRLDETQTFQTNNVFHAKRLSNNPPPRSVGVMNSSYHYNQINRPRIHCSRFTFTSNRIFFWASACDANDLHNSVDDMHIKMRSPIYFPVPIASPTMRVMIIINNCFV